MKTEDDLKNMEDILSEEDNDDNNDDVTVDNPDDDNNDNNDDDDQDDTNDDNNDDNNSDDDNTKNKVVITEEDFPAIGAVNKKYPELFKDFPGLRHAIFHAKEYRELFATVDDAKEAVQNLEILGELQEAVNKGDVDTLLNTFKEISEDAIPAFSQNFLPSLRKSNQDVYFNVITPVLVDYTRSLYNAGVRNENDNMKNAALVAALHMFGDQKVATGEKEVKINTKTETPKDEKLENERKAFKRERYTTLYNDVTTTADSQLSKLILDGLDPKGVMTKGVKDLVAKKVLEEVNNSLTKNKFHYNKMNSLWKKAEGDNFSVSHKQKIVSVYLQAAKEIMPRIRSKVRAETLGIRERHSANNGGAKERVEPRGNTSRRNSENQRGNGKNVDAKNVDWKKTSDLDFLKDKVTLKS